MLLYYPTCWGRIKTVSNAIKPPHGATLTLPISVAFSHNINVIAPRSLKASADEHAGGQTGATGEGGWGTKTFMFSIRAPVLQFLAGPTPSADFIV